MGAGTAVLHTRLHLARSRPSSGMMLACRTSSFKRSSHRFLGLPRGLFPITVIVWLLASPPMRALCIVRSPVGCGIGATLWMALSSPWPPFALCHSTTKFVCRSPAFPGFLFPRAPLAAYLICLTTSFQMASTGWSRSTSLSLSWSLSFPHLIRSVLVVHACQCCPRSNWISITRSRRCGPMLSDRITLTLVASFRSRRLSIH